VVSRHEDWRWSSYNEYAGMSAEEQERTRTTKPVVRATRSFALLAEAAFR
jgi:hypothetical protein